MVTISEPGEFGAIRWSCERGDGERAGKYVL